MESSVNVKNLLHGLIVLSLPHTRDYKKYYHREAKELNKAHIGSPKTIIMPQTNTAKQFIIYDSYDNVGNP